MHKYRFRMTWRLFFLYLPFLQCALDRQVSFLCYNLILHRLILSSNYSISCIGRSGNVWCFRSSTHLWRWCQWLWGQIELLYYVSCIGRSRDVWHFRSCDADTSNDWIEPVFEVGALCNPNLLPDYCGDLFQHKFARLVQQDIKDTNDDLVYLVYASSLNRCRPRQDTCLLAYTTYKRIVKGTQCTCKITNT